MDFEKVMLQVLPRPEDDLDDLMSMTVALRADLLDVDVESVDLVSAESTPDRAKGLATLAGSLIVKLASLNVLRAVVDTVIRWSSRTNRTVEVSIGEDTMKVTGLTSAQMDEMIRVWVSRHTPVS